MKLLSYGLDQRMEPRLAFSLGGYAVDVMRASLWMKEKHKANDYLSLASNMVLTLEDWDRSFALLSNLKHAFQGLDLSGLSIYDRSIALPETEIVFFSPIPNPPSLRLFSAFDDDKAFVFGNTQTLLGHKQTLAFSDLSPQAEMAAIIGGKENNPIIAGYCIANNWQNLKTVNNSGILQGMATSLGPYLLTSDELDGHKLGGTFSLDLQTRVNGISQAEGSLKGMVHSFEEIVGIAGPTRVQAGDVFCSGSPVNLTQEGANPGDQVDVEIQVLGTLSTPIVKQQTTVLFE